MDFLDELDKENICYQLCGCFSYKDEKTNIYLFLKDNIGNFYLSKAGGNGFLEEVFFDDFNDFKMLLNDYFNIDKMDFLIPKNTLEKEGNNKNIKISKNDLHSAELTYINNVKTLYNFITNERLNNMEKNLNGYIKLIGYSKDGDTKSYDFYFENEDETMYKINISYNENVNFNTVTNLHTSIETFDKKDLYPENFKGLFYVPRSFYEFNVNTDEVNGILTPRGCEIGEIAEFNTDFVSIFENQMHFIGKERVIGILSFNKDNFEDFVEGIHELSLDSVDMSDDILDVFAQIPNIPSFSMEDFTEKTKSNKNRLNAFGNYADYDDYSR